MPVFCMLLKDQSAVEKSHTLYDRKRDIEVLKGSLWYTDDHIASQSSSKSLKLYSLLDKEGVRTELYCPANEVARLTGEQCELLKPIATCGDRYKVFQDQSWLSEIVRIKVNTTVYVLKVESESEKLIGRVRYRGSVPDISGIYFGVELSAEFSGKGTTDGIFRKQRFFTCASDSALFVTVNRLRICTKSELFKPSTEFDYGNIKDISGNSPVEHEVLDDRSLSPPPLEIGERIVWFGDQGTYPGTVHWIGVLPDSSGQEWTVGVEFDDPVGTGTGKYQNKQLFKAKSKHASLIPIIGLIKESEYLGNSTDYTMPGRNHRKPYTPANYAAPTVASQARTTGGSALAGSRPGSSAGSRPGSSAGSRPGSSAGSRPGHNEKPPSRSDPLSPDSGGSKRGASPNTSTARRRSPQPAPRPPDREYYINSYKTGTRNVQGPLTHNHRDMHENGYYDEISPRHGGHQRHDYDMGQISKSSSTTERFLDNESTYSSIAEYSTSSRGATGAAAMTSLPYLDARNNHATSGAPTPPMRNHGHSTTYAQVHRPNNATSSAIKHNSPIIDDFFKVEGRALSPRDRTTDAHAPLRSPQPSAPPPRYSDVMENQDGHYDTIDEADSSFASMSMTSQTKRAPANVLDSTSVYSSGIGSAGSHDLSSRASARHTHEQQPFPAARAYSQHLSEHSDGLGDHVRSSMSSGTSSMLTQYTNAGAVPNSSLSSRGHVPTIHEDPVSHPSTRTRSTYSSGGASTSGAEQSLKAIGFNQTALTARDASSSMSKTSFPASTKSRTLTTKQPRAKAVDPKEVGCEFEIGSMVEVANNPPNCRYGVIRWLGRLGDKPSIIAGLEMEEESDSCTDGHFGEEKIFSCDGKKAFFVYMKQLRRDARFEESSLLLHRSEEQSFGSLDCPDVDDVTAPPREVTTIDEYIGQNKGIQGHHNSCYLDATLYAMFSFSTVFDSVLLREQRPDDISEFPAVQQIMRNGIVYPLRKNLFVRADKVLSLRQLLDKVTNITGLMTEEKDPEELLTCLLQHVLKVEPFLKLSSNQEAHLYQLFVEKDEKILLPTTQQLLQLSFHQSRIKLQEIPSVLILQMPRFGKDFKMYDKILPSLELDITDLLEYGPRECHHCGKYASYECRDCFELIHAADPKYGGEGDGLQRCCFCSSCVRPFHSHRARQSHTYKPLERNKEYEQYMESAQRLGYSMDDLHISREKMELFAVICIERSHYVSFVKCGSGTKVPWVFFDSMADRKGAQNGYNIPEVKRCEFLPDLLQNRQSYSDLCNVRDNKLLEPYTRRLLCDAYICLYQHPDLSMYR